MDQLEEFIVFNVCKYLNVDELPELHKKYVLTLYRSMDPNIFRGYKISKVGPILGTVLGNKLRSLVREESTIDIKEYQTKMLGTADQDPGLIGGPTETDLALKSNLDNSNDKSININNFLGINDLNEFKMLFNPESMHVHYYLALDSNFRETTYNDPINEVSSSIKKFTWKYAPTQYTGTGFCNSVGVIRDVIGMRMYQPRVPYLAAMNTSAKRVSVLIEEFKAQAFIAENGRRYHFLLRPNFIAGQTSIELSTEEYNDGIFNFRNPITKIDSITLSFGDPLEILTFSTPFDRFMVFFEFVCLKSDK